MLKKILFEAKKHFDLDEKRGVFVSVFDKNGKLLLSKGTVYTDKTIKQQLEGFYNAFLNKSSKKIKTVVIDIIKNITQLNNPQDILSTDTGKYGVLIISSNGEEAGVILPDVRGVADIKNALYLIKKKFDIKNKKVTVYRFETQRLFVS